MQTSLWLWSSFNLFVLVLLALDLGVLHRRRREISLSEALWLSTGYFGLALFFNAGIFYFNGRQAGYEFLTGYLIEKSLSLDNIFVFVLIFSYFTVPVQYQHRVLFWGIIGAVVMRGVLIALGAQLIVTFHWIIFIFGAFLIFTGIKMLVMIDAKPDLANNWLLSLLRRRIRVTDEYHQEKFFIRRDGLVWATPLFLVLVLIEFTDLVFAVDSIPAIFAITQDPFIVYTSNVFAILGLRALYFALAGIIHRFHYLKYGLSLVLVVIGGKMIVNGVFGGKVVPTEVALAITATLILGSIVLSLIKTRDRVESAASNTGWVPGSPPAPPPPTAAK
ncbi:MAG TPA: TerC family protein [Alphaproteobacteria bacterium]|nr:TerC family protein [Alphaproteobacteria bacterium]